MRAGTSAARRRPQQGAPDDAGLGGKPLRLLSAKVRLVIALGAMALAAGLAGASSGSGVWTITTFAGSGVAGFAGDGGPASGPFCPEREHRVLGDRRRRARQRLHLRLRQ